MVDDVAELVEHDAIDPASAVQPDDAAEVDGHLVARAAGLGEADGAGLPGRADRDVDEPVDQVDEAAGVRAGRTGR